MTNAELMKLVDNNDGTLIFITTLLETISAGKKQASKALQIILIIQMIGIIGDDLYILWSDLGDKDLDKIYTICTKVPHDILVEACLQQDYSGVKLIEKYIK